MRGHGRIIVVASAMVSVVGAFLSPVVEAIPPPDRIESSKPAIHSAPVWVSAEHAIDDGGALVREFFMPWELEALDRAMATYKALSAQGFMGSTFDPCRDASHGYADYTPPDPALDDLFTHSVVVFNGTVQGLAQGFYLGTPSTLYSVEVDKVWKGRHAIPADNTVFVVLPQATIQLGEDVRLCARTARSPSQPAPGERVLIFSFREPPWAPIFNPMDEEFFFQTDTSVSLPSHFTRERDAVPVDIEEIVTMLEESR